jgi:deoxyribonuclease-4
VARRRREPCAAAGARLEPRPLIGAHVSAAGGLASCVARAQALGAEVVQVFSSSPRQWRAPSHPPAEVSAFGRTLGALGVPLFVHSSYLINLASPDGELRARSAAGLARALGFAALAGAAGVVTHVGSHRGTGFEAGAGRLVDAVVQATQTVGADLEGRCPRPSSSLPLLLLETSAGGGDSLGRSPAELGRLVQALDRAGVPAGVCLDTAHLFAAGYPVQLEQGLEALLEELGAEVGLDRVGLVHLNDSRSGLGSLADHHENLWEGQIGREGLAGWVCHPALRDVPFVLEVPGFDGRGPDRRNLGRARRLRRPTRRSLHQAHGEPG